MDVFLHAEAGEGDGGSLVAFSPLLTGELGAAAVGQTDIAEDELK